MENNQDPIEVKATLIETPYTSKNIQPHKPKQKQINILSEAVEELLTFPPSFKYTLADILIWVSYSAAVGTVAKSIIVWRIPVHWIINLIVGFVLAGIGIFFYWAWTDISVKARTFMVIRVLLVVLGIILGGN